MAKSRDVRGSFVTYNSWNGKLPCPSCLPKVHPMTTPCPKDLHGVMRITGQRISTGKMIWNCYDCQHSEEK